IDRRRGTKLERGKHFQSALRAALKNKPAPARHLPLADARPAAAQVRPREIDQIAHRRWLLAKEPKPRPNDERAGAVNDDVKSLFKQLGMLLNQRAIEGARDVGDRHRIVKRNVAGEIDLDHVV